VFVEGNAELTPARLIGAFDPSQVLSEGYRPDTFLDGPLLTAMRGGGLLYLEELNRVPEETLNVLITVLTEGEDRGAEAGARCTPASGFRLIAAMNPFRRRRHRPGSARPSPTGCAAWCSATRTRPPSAPSPRAMTGHQTAAWSSCRSGWPGPTREHRDVRMGSSVRGAIDLVHLLTGLTRPARRAPAGARDRPRRRLRRAVRPDPGLRRGGPHRRVGDR